MADEKKTLVLRAPLVAIGAQKLLYRPAAITISIDHSFLKVQWRSYKKLYELLLSSTTITAISCVQPLAVIQI